MLAWVALGCLAQTSCHRTPPAAQSKEAQRQQEDLSLAIRKLRREVNMLQQSAAGSKVDISNLGKSSKPPQEEMQLLQRDVFRLARALDRQTDHAQSGGTVLPFPVAGTGQVIEAQIPPGTSCDTLTIINTGESIIKEPEVTPEGSTRLDSAENILAGILQGKAGDQEKALALWDFIRTSRQHYFPSQEGNDAEDPVKLINIYGYGYCDDAATALAWLATAAGYQARVWDLDGHVVPEIFYQNTWHMLDPDEEVYYLDDQGTIASVEWLSRHPETITNRQGGKPIVTARLAEFYRTTSNNRLEKIAREIKEPIYRMAFSLRPGEELTLSREPSGKFFSSKFYWSHPPHGTGRWDFTPVLEKDLFKLGATQTENLRVEEGLAAQVVEREASLVYEFSPSYPMLDGKVSGEAQLAKGAQFLVEFSSDGRTWQEVAKIQGPLQGTWNASLVDCFPNGYGVPLYRCFLRLRIPAGKAGEVLISRYRISLDLKVAPKSVPILTAGIRRLLYTSKGDANDHAQIDLVARPAP